jgi:hypothetical protein
MEYDYCYASSVCFVHLQYLLQVRGLGLEGEAAAEEALLYTLRERPGGPDQLLVGSRPAALVQLAGLAESCDWVADCLRDMAAAAAGETACLLLSFCLFCVKTVCLDHFGVVGGGVEWQPPCCAGAAGRTSRELQLGG